MSWYWKDGQFRAHREFDVDVIRIIESKTTLRVHAEDADDAQLIAKAIIEEGTSGRFEIIARHTKVEAVRKLKRDWKIIHYPDDWPKCPVCGEFAENRQGLCDNDECMKIREDKKE